MTDPAKIVSAPLCLNGDVATALGGNFANWTYSIASSLYGDTKDPGMVNYMKVTKGILAPGDAPDPWVIVDFGELLTGAKILNQTGASAPAATIIKALRGFKGPLALGAPNLACGQFKDAPSICNNQTQFFAYTGKSLAAPSWEHAKGSGWIKQAAGEPEVATSRSDRSM